MNDASRSATEGRGGRRLRTALVTVQVAMAVVILIAAGLLGRSFAALMRVDPGFLSEGIMSMQLTLPQLKYDTPEKRAAFVEQMQQRVSEIPGASAAGAMYPLPMSGQGWSGTYTVEGEPAGPEVQLPHGEYAVAMPGYFQTMGIPMLDGRDFTRADRDGAPRVAIVDERLEQRHWPNQSAISKRINTSGRAGDWIMVVGVVKHVYNSGPQSEGEAQLYLPYLQSTQAPIFVVVRSSGNVLSLAGGMRTAIRELDRDLPISKPAPMDQLVSTAVAGQRFNTLMFGVFALAALTIAGIGLYGVMSHLVAQRTREIGIRIALGGRPADVRWMVLRESLLISFFGVAIGCAASLSFSRLMAGFMFRIEPADPITYGGIVLLLLAVSILASYGPALRATRIDPMVALRE